ncbi:hypothetical protein THIARS_40003 [Thiomonas delicata]|uniref:Uncharacterized protein n=1 Tax=Thiomonas delicata TaxID=364030 RepID=A0A238CZG5_THIDL|nr:hypothetical protein THIARS_40003 [Thiomonas delicata]
MQNRRHRYRYTKSKANFLGKGPKHE